jgi:hypothetical protein
LEATIGGTWKRGDREAKAGKEVEDKERKGKLCNIDV